LNKFADHARYTYNKAVELVNGGASANKMRLRNELVTKKDNDFFDDKTWLLETPKVIRQQAVFEACKNFKACFTNLKNQNIKKFNMRFKSKKTKEWTIGVEHYLKAIDAEGENADNAKKRLVILPKCGINEVRYYGSLPFDDVPGADCFLRKDKRGCYFLMVPVKKRTRPICRCDERPIVALDPGVRNFLTGFRSDSAAFILGDGFASRLVGILQHVDTIDKQMTSVNALQRQRLKKKKLLLFQKYKDVRDEFQWKVINWLTKEHSLILLPQLQTSKLSRSPRTKGNREMLHAGHYTFLQRLKHKCRERNVGLMIVDEDYTSKTCGSCGTLVNVGSSETFSCNTCSFITDRDVNGARNILLKHMRVTSIDPVALRKALG
jgi:transposase